ncbi:hypothetical protein D3C85_1526890 [compost metagenome]
MSKLEYFNNSSEMLLQELLEVAKIALVALVALHGEIIVASKVVRAGILRLQQVFMVRPGAASLA